MSYYVVVRHYLQSFYKLSMIVTVIFECLSLIHTYVDDGKVMKVVFASNPTELVPIVVETISVSGDVHTLPIYLLNSHTSLFITLAQIIDL